MIRAILPPRLRCIGLYRPDLHHCADYRDLAACIEHAAGELRGRYIDVENGVAGDLETPGPVLADEEIVVASSQVPDHVSPVLRRRGSIDIDGLLHHRPRLH